MLSCGSGHAWHTSTSHHLLHLSHHVRVLHHLASHAFHAWWDHTRRNISEWVSTASTSSTTTSHWRHAAIHRRHPTAHWRHSTAHSSHTCCRLVGSSTSRGLRCLGLRASHRWHAHRWHSSAHRRHSTHASHTWHGALTCSCGVVSVEKRVRALHHILLHACEHGCERLAERRREKLLG